MNLSRLTYTKTVSERCPKDSVQTTPPKKERSRKSVDVSGLSAAYQKREGVLASNLVFVLSGGEKKERDFLRELIKNHRIRSLRVIFMSKTGQGLQPYQMQEKWQKIQASGRVETINQECHLEDMDKVFLLADVDEFYKQLVKINVQIKASDQGQWIISNPCFEIWLYYCYRGNPAVDLVELKNCTAAKRSKKLKSLGQTLVSGGLNPCHAFERMIVGIEHSKSHYAVDENGIPVLFATQMHKMAQYMVETMNKNANEYSEILKQRAEWKRRMRDNDGNSNRNRSQA